MCVALLAEGVDRNCLTPMVGVRLWVALLAEGVDRNIIQTPFAISAAVALLAEGVDRNIPKQLLEAEASGSPSSRRAWIEIMWGGSLTMLDSVALLAEGVDRNSDLLHQDQPEQGRPPRGGRG